MGKTKMTVRDFMHLGGCLPSFYAPVFAASPEAAAAIERLTHSLEDLPNFMTDRDGDYDEDGLEIPEGTMHVASLGGNDVMTEEHLRMKGLDLVVNETLATLRKEVQNGHIKPGTVQYTITAYTIDALEKIRRREYVPTPVNLESRDFPGFMANNKVANYTITPKLDGFRKVTVTDSTGKEKEEYRFPEGYAEDSMQDGTFFMPRQDLVNNAKYTAEELNAAADRINFNGLTTAATDYMTQMRQINNLIGMQSPETPEQEQILKQHALASLNRLKAEIKSSMMVPLDDPVALRFFGDSEKNISDTLSEGSSADRALGKDRKAVEEYISFLNSGMPITAFTEYQDIKNAFYSMSIDALSMKDTVEGMGELHEKSESFLQHLTNPPQNMDEETRKQWLSEVKQNLNTCLSEYQKVKDHIPYRDEAIRKTAKANVDRDFAHEYLRKQAIANGVTAQNQQEAYIRERIGSIEADPDFQKAREAAYQKDYEKRKEDIRECFQGTNKSIGRTAHKIEKTILPSFDAIGTRNVKERQRYVRKMMKDMADDMDTIGKELSDLAAKQSNLDPKLKQAIADVKVLGNPNKGRSPLQFMQALNNAQAAAIIQGNSKITEYIARNKAYLSNRMEEAKSKGVLMDESLIRQLRVSTTKDRDNIDNALAMFNTRRSGIFGGRGTEFGKESIEHKNLREEATKYANLKKNLLNNKQLEATDPEAWRKLSREVQNQADTVSRLAMIYFAKTNLKAGSPAGKQRISGAMGIYTDAENTRVQLRLKEAAMDRYQELSRSTEKQLEANAAREQELRAREEAFRKEAAAKQANRNEQQASAGPQNAPKNVQAAPQGPQNLPKEPQAVPKEPQNAPKEQVNPAKNPAPVQKDSKPHDISFADMEAKLRKNQPSHEFQGRRSVSTAPEKQGPAAEDTIRRSNTFSK